MDIGKKWRITSDSMNITLERKRTRTNKDTKDKYEAWEVAGYFATIEGALTELVNQGVRETELKDLKAINDRITKLEKTIGVALRQPTSPTGASK